MSCDSKWHQRAASAGGIIWFWLGVRLNDDQGTYVYRVGPEPDDTACRTIWCYGDKGVPWTCCACGIAIGSERYRPPNSQRT